MPTKSERRAQRQAQQRKQKLITTLAIGLGILGVITILVIILVGANKAPIPSSGLTLGNPDAPIKVTEFADFQCPACSYFVLNIKPELTEKYIATGKVHFTFSPYSFLGQESLDAAEAAFCAADQNRFWDYYEYLFTNQGTFENGGTFSIANLNLYAQRLELDAQIFSECLDSGKYQQAVLDANDIARSAGMRGTPSFLVNGKIVTSQKDLIPTIESLLAEQ